jgi:hypothetical protein
MVVSAAALSNKGTIWKWGLFHSFLRIMDKKKIKLHRFAA